MASILPEAGSSWTLNDELRPSTGRDRLFHIHALKAVTMHNVGMDQEPPPIVHAPGCGLDSVHFLRHAAAAVGMLTHEEPDPSADRVSAEAFADVVARFAEQDDWATVTLKDVADQATLMNTAENRERFKYMCTCGALG